MDQNISIVKILLLFNVLISGSLLKPLLSKQWNEMVQNNRLIQHIIGLTTMITLVTLISEGHSGYLHIIAYSLAGYLWFILSTKMDIHWNIMVMILLLGSYLYENSLKVKDNKTDEDKVLSEEEKNIIKNKNSDKNMYVVIGALSAILFGVYMYSNKKEVQYGGGYSLVNFLLY